MQQLRDRLLGGMVGIVIGLLIAAAICVWKRETPLTESAAPEIRLPDQSLALERDPDSKIDKPMLIKGGKIERQIKVDIQPDRQDCPVCTAVLTVERMKDGTRRVIASSPTGTVLGGLDVPVLPSYEPPKLWAAGLGYGESGTVSAWVERDFGPVRIGGDLLIRDGGTIPMLRMGWRF